MTDRLSEIENLGKNGQANGPLPKYDGQDDPSTGEPPDPNAFHLDLLSPADFAGRIYKREWIVKRILVREQPAFMGGPRKGLKTTAAVDMAVSIGTGTPFLGEFETTKMRVGLLSGESGEATLQETFRRVCAAKSVEPSDCGVYIGFNLPQFSNIEHLAEIRRVIGELGLRVLIYDPLYLGMLAGLGAEGLQASNLYHVGPLLMGFTRTCLDAGCTPVMLHHFKITRADPHGEPQLDDLAFAGVQEFARQWLLVGRREKYEPGTGSHRLWLSVGGSSGHGGLWAVDVEEGAISDDFSGREWRVSLTSGSEAKTEKRDEKDQQRRDRLAQQDREDDDAVMVGLDRLDKDHSGAVIEHVRLQARLSDARMIRAVSRLREAKLIEELGVTIEVGNGAKRPAKGIRRHRPESF